MNTRWRPAAALSAVAAIAVAAISVAFGGSTAVAGQPVATASLPEPITRAELMVEYAEIAPYDQSATPETIDQLADTACQGIDDGVSTDELITATNDIYGADATRVLQLLVSYGCPEHLADFK